MGLMQSPGIYLAIKVYCSPQHSGSLAQEFPATAHVLSLYVGDRPHGTCVSSSAGSGSLIQVYFSLDGAFRFGFSYPSSPKNFLWVVPLAVSLEQCPSKWEDLSSCKEWLIYEHSEGKGLGLFRVQPAQRAEVKYLDLSLDILLILVSQVCIVSPQGSL